ncbi:MAG: GNAT family N-acetyltransferase [Pseudomonadales bacterium]
MTPTPASDQRPFLRSVNLFRPYADEVPWVLFDTLPGNLTAEQMQALVASAQSDAQDCFLRVAKLDNEVIGAYIMRRQDQQSFELVYLAVAQSQRHKGLGHWLTGHAIGVAESKGGRRLLAADCALKRFLRAYGFSGANAEQVFEFVPE